MRICLLHFSGPPMTGGVEQTLYYHARTLADLGHRPSLVVGQGQEFDERIPVRVIPELYSKHMQVLEAKRGLDQGRVNQTFHELRIGLRQQLQRPLCEADVCVIHNALTLHKNLSLTAALWEMLARGELPPAVIGWHHDLAWDRPDYGGDLHPGFPWNLLKMPWPGVTNVVVSQAQRARLARLYSVEPDMVRVIPPGIDPAQTGQWTDLTQHVISELDLARADAVLLLPARVTRRKNIGFAIEILAALRQMSRLDVRVLVTGPPGPHNPTNAAHLRDLLDLRARLGLEACCHFAYQLGGDRPLILDDDTMANLFSFCDALLFPSLNEGFGIPMLEAAFTRMPVFCSDIAPFQESGGSEAHYFDPSGSPEDAARLIKDRLFTSPSWRLRRRVLACYTWKRIVEDQMLPLLGE
jgi:glycosyltransferase involved in cell wall biosynthesis